MFFTSIFSPPPRFLDVLRMRACVRLCARAIFWDQGSHGLNNRSLVHFWPATCIFMLIYIFQNIILRFSNFLFFLNVCIVYAQLGEYYLCNGEFPYESGCQAAEWLYLIVSHGAEVRSVHLSCSYLHRCISTCRASPGARRWKTTAPVPWQRRARLLFDFAPSSNSSCG